MAIHNDPMMYRGGAVVFNNQPAVNLYAQTLARKQAREEALDEYERNRINRINEAGLRDQDREGFDQEILGLKSYYSQNKNAIGKKNTPEAYEYEKKFRNVANYIGGSKDLTARATATEKYRQERMKMGRNTSDELWDDLQKNELPMTDPNHVPIDIAKYQKTQTPKYDQAKSIKMYAGITKMPTTPRYEDIPGRPDLKNEIVEYKFDDAGKNAIRARAEKEFDEDDAFLNIVQSQVNDTIQAARLEKVFEDNFGTKPRNMKDYAVASKMDELQQTSRTEKRVDDWPYKTGVNQAFQLKKQEIGHANSLELLKMRPEIAQKYAELNNVWIDNFVDKLEEEAKQTPSVPYKTESGKITNEFIVPLNSTLAQALAKDGIQPDQVRVTADGKFRPIWFKRDKVTGEVLKDGNTAAVDPIRSIPQSKDQTKLDLGKKSTGVKQLITEMLSDRGKPAKKEIKRSDIKTRADAAGYSEKEYEQLLKQKGIKIID